MRFLEGFRGFLLKEFQRVSGSFWRVIKIFGEIKRSFRDFWRCLESFRRFPMSFREVRGFWVSLRNFEEKKTKT